MTETEKLCPHEITIWKEDKIIGKIKCYPCSYRERYGEELYNKYYDENRKLRRKYRN